MVKVLIAPRLVVTPFNLTVPTKSSRQTVATTAFTPGSYPHLLYNFSFCRQHARVPTEDESAADHWADPAEAEVSLAAVVEEIFSEVSAMCLGRFGQNVLVATTDGEVRVYAVLVAPSLFAR